jgi:hypothetical protein
MRILTFSSYGFRRKSNSENGVVRPFREERTVEHDLSLSEIAIWHCRRLFAAAWQTCA